jgi:hypothetical protein
MKKKIIFGVILLCIIFVVADYCELLGGGLHKDGSISIPFSFQFFDTQNNPVSNVTIKTFLNDQDFKNHSGCDDDNALIVLGYVSFGAGWKETILFKKPNPYRRIKNEELKFFFQHPDYVEQEKVVSVQADFVKQPDVFINDGTATPFR